MITEAFVRRILDSRGNPTVEVDIVTEEGFGRAAAPSGASTGAHEVRAWPEGGVDAAVNRAWDEVLPRLIGREAQDQTGLDALLEEIDGTPDFSRIGGNLAVAVSLANAKAAAHNLNLPLYAYLGGNLVDEVPVPFGNVLGGGAHAVGGTDFQEFMAVSMSDDAATNVLANAWVHGRVKELLKEELPGQALGKGDEGAWVAPISDERALEIVALACDEASDAFDILVRPALDPAASELFDGDHYIYRDTKRTSEEQVEFVAGLVKDHDVVSVEDPLDENDWEAWIDLTDRIGSECLVVGDDIFTTDAELVQEGIDRGAANAVLVKPNQVGTLSRTVETIRLAHRNGLETVVSHRSGETTDASIAHIGAGLGCLGIKCGAVGGERIAKLNELIRIAEEL